MRRDCAHSDTTRAHEDERIVSGEMCLRPCIETPVSIDAELISEARGTAYRARAQAKPICQLLSECTSRLGERYDSDRLHEINPKDAIPFGTLILRTFPKHVGERRVVQTRTIVGIAQ